LGFLGTTYTYEHAHAQSPSVIPEGYTIIEGDILVRTGLYLAASGTQLWPNGTVPFEFDANVTVANQTAMRNAMAQWERVANVRFVQCPGNTCPGNQTDYVHIQDSAANNSPVGMQGGQQVINIVSWTSPFIIAHELAHTLGMWHEQSRPDRNNYIQINNGTNGTANNIQAGQASQFAIHNTADVYPKREYGLPDAETYDFDSVMHYSQCSFSIDCPAGSSCACTNVAITILAPNQAWQPQIGQRTHLSRLDRLTMSFLYPQNDWRFVDQTHTGSQQGSFLEPYNTFVAGVQNAPAGSTLQIQPGTYAAAGRYDRPMVLQAPLGHTKLGQ